MLRFPASSFKWQLTFTPPKSHVVIDIDKEFVENIPYLAHLQPLHAPSTLQTTAQVCRDGSSHGDTAPVHVKSEPGTQEAGEMHAHHACGAAAGAGHAGEAVSFDPPGSACGLACVLLLMEGVAAPRDLFDSGMHAPSLACEAVWVCPSNFPE